MDPRDGCDVMVEIFECAGSVSFLISNNYSKLESNKSAEVEYSKVAGHYVAVLPTYDNDADPHFAKVQLEPTKSSPSAIVNYRYSYFHTEKSPFNSISLPETQLEYTIGDDDVNIMLPQVEV